MQAFILSTWETNKQNQTEQLQILGEYPKIQWLESSEP